jgi:hypothetical protein
MTETPQTPEDPQEPAGGREVPTASRGDDDRKGDVNPADDPAPHSPEADEDAVRKSEEILDRIKPY